MKNSLQDLLSTLDTELEGELESRLRAELETRDKAWLLEAMVQQILQDRHLHETSHRQLSRQARQVEPLAERRQRLDRIRSLGLDDNELRQTVERYRALSREALVAEGHLVDPPHKGKEALGPEHRSATGQTLLQNAHDLLYALLFCDEGQGVRLNRVRRDFITVTLPSAKAGSLERFMLAVTEIQVAGTWLDPEGVSDDIGATNKILQVEFGDSADGLVCEALIATLTLINNLEVNEEILYARIEQLERSTLV
jgi:hypothetical protein